MERPKRVPRRARLESASQALRNTHSREALERWVADPSGEFGEAFNVGAGRPAWFLTEEVRREYRGSLAQTKAKHPNAKQLPKKLSKYVDSAGRRYYPVQQDEDRMECHMRLPERATGVYFPTSLETVTLQGRRYYVESCDPNGWNERSRRGCSAVGRAGKVVLVAADKVASNE